MSLDEKEEEKRPGVNHCMKSPQIHFKVTKRINEEKGVDNYGSVERNESENELLL